MHYSILQAKKVEKKERRIPDLPISVFDWNDLNITYPILIPLFFVGRSTARVYFSLTAASRVWYYLERNPARDRETKPVSRGGSKSESNGEKLAIVRRYEALKKAFFEKEQNLKEIREKEKILKLEK